MIIDANSIQESYEIEGILHVIVAPVIVYTMHHTQPILRSSV